MTLLERWKAGTSLMAGTENQIARAIALAQAAQEYNESEEQLVHTGMEAIDWIMRRADELEGKK